MQKNPLTWEADAKALAHCLGLSVQRVYQLEQMGELVRSENGNFNLHDAICDYLWFKRFGSRKSAGVENVPDFDISLDDLLE